MNYRSSMDGSGSSYWLHSEKSIWNCCFPSYSNLTTEMWFALISGCSQLVPPVQSGPVTGHPNTVWIAYGHLFALGISFTGSRTLGTFHPIKSKTSELISGRCRSEQTAISEQMAILPRNFSWPVVYKKIFVPLPEISSPLIKFSDSSYSEWLWTVLV